MVEWATLSLLALVLGSLLTNNTLVNLLNVSGKVVWSELLWAVGTLLSNTVMLLPDVPPQSTSCKVL